MTAEALIPDRKLPRWKAVLFVGVVVLVAGAVLEVVARLALRAFDGFDGRHLYQYDFDPYKNLLPKPNYVDTRGIRHNAVGFRRSGEVSRAKPAGTYRIFLMGGSTAYGLGSMWTHIQRDYAVVDNAKTIDAALEQILGATYSDVQFEVINAAIVSTWTHHTLIYLNQTILDYDPDIVLFLDGYNDFFFFHRQHDQFASYSYNMPSRVILGDPTLFSLAYSNGWWLFRKSAFVHVLARGGRFLTRLLPSARTGPPPPMDDALEGLRYVFPRNALKMHRRIGLILQDEDVHAVFMLQPLLILEGDRTGMPPAERRLFDFNVSVTRPGWGEYVRDAVAFIRDRETEMAADVDGIFLDLTDVFVGTRGQMFTDYAHLTPRGNAVVARRIALAIAPLIEADLVEGRLAPVLTALTNP